MSYNKSESITMTRRKELHIKQSQTCHTEIYMLKSTEEKILSNNAY
jgi:hypothetical protein